MKLQKGQASLIIELSDGLLTVKHGTGDTILINRPMKQGEYKKMFKSLETKFK